MTSPLIMATMIVCTYMRTSSVSGDGFLFMCLPCVFSSVLLNISYQPIVSNLGILPLWMRHIYHVLCVMSRMSYRCTYVIQMYVCHTDVRMSYRCTYVIQMYVRHTNVRTYVNLTFHSLEYHPCSPVCWSSFLTLAQLRALTPHNWGTALAFCHC